MRTKKHYNVGNKSNWKGGKFIDCRGYTFVLVGDKYIGEHRLVMEQHLGRRLDFKEKIHHKNGNKSDNRLENLQLVSQSEHAKIEGLGKNLKGKKKTKQHLANRSKAIIKSGVYKGKNNPNYKHGKYVKQ